MGIDFGNGPTLKDACPCLRDERTRIEMILDVAERNSVIEGLPPFQEEFRRHLREQLMAIASQRPKPAE